MKKRASFFWIFFRVANDDVICIQYDPFGLFAVFRPCITFWCSSEQIQKSKATPLFQA